MQPLSNILPNGTPIEADSYTVTQRKYISDYEYFKYLTKDGYGENTTHTCPTVATQILLSYNNWANEEWLRAAMTFQTSHVHNDQTLNGNSHILFCEDCERTKTTNNHMLSSCEFDNNFHHIEVCTCGYKVKRLHTTKYIIIDSSKHEAHCKVCGYFLKSDYHYYKYGNTCFYCGYGLER